MFVIQNNNNFQTFYINEIQSKIPGKNKYIDYQYVKTDIEYLFYKIKYNFTFYVAGNYNLPADALLFNISSPTFTIENLQMFEVDEDVDKSIQNIQYDACKVYKASAIIDIGEDNFFNGGIDRYYNLDFSFEINLSSLDKNENNEIEIDKFNKFMNEMKTSKLNLELFQQNFIKVNDSGYFNHVYKSSFDVKNNNFLLDEKIFFKLNEINYSYKPIKKLFSINKNIDDILTIENVILKLFYEVDNVQKESKLVFQASKNYYSNNIIFELNNYETFFDRSKQEIGFRKGSNGISFPFDTKACYELYFTMILKNKPLNYLVTKEFNFKKEQITTNFFIDHFRNELIDYEEIFIE